jgi:hypothetical protein
VIVVHIPGKKSLAILTVLLCISCVALAQEENQAPYTPGTLNVRIPKALLPPPIEVEVEVPLEPGDPGYGDEQTQPSQQANPNGTTVVGGQVVEGKLPPNKAMTPIKRPKTKKVKKLVPAPSPYEAISIDDFKWYENDSGRYVMPLPKSFGGDPLKGYPIYGPMIIRNVNDALFMTVTVDDPTDTQHYRNKDSLPNFYGAIPIVKETRTTVQNQKVDCTYFRYQMSGTNCLVLQTALPYNNKTYRMLYVFPEDRRFRILPLSLYSLENFRIN